MDLKNLPRWTGNNLIAYFFAKPNQDPVDAPMVLQYDTVAGLRELLVLDIKPPYNPENDPRFEIKCLNRHFRKITIFANPVWDVEIKGDSVFYIRNFK